MATNYAGLITPPINQDQVPPNAGSVPSISVPADIDPNNVATMFTQQYKTVMDYQAYLQKTALWRPSVAVGAVAGFTAVDHTGPGTGTVTPSTPGAANQQPTGTNAWFVYKIIVGGAVATATFQLSRDGGVTYGATTATAATFTDSVTGIKVAFAGTFTAGDLYAFRTTHTPIAQFVDVYDSIPRLQVDHQGIYTPKYYEFYEDWAVAHTGISSSIAAAGAFGGGQRWFGNFIGAGNSIAKGQMQGADLNGNLIYLPGVQVTASGNGNRAFLQGPTMQDVGRTMLLTQSCFGFFGGSGVPGADESFGVGLASNLGIFDTYNVNSGGATFYKLEGQSTIHFMYGGVDVDTGITPVALRWYPFRIEVYGTSFAGGARVRAFIDGKCIVDVIPANVGSVFSSGDFVIDCRNDTAAGTASAVIVSPVRQIWAPFANVPSI